LPLNNDEAADRINGTTFAVVRLSQRDRGKLATTSSRLRLLDSKLLAGLGDAVVDHLPVHLVDGDVLEVRAEKGALVVDVVFDSVALRCGDGSHPLAIRLASAGATAE
jgi:hypothetical protein